MKIAVISDVHSNLAALEEVLADIAESGINKIWCLGDVVGYGPQPWVCWTKLKNSQFFDVEIIMGNHEAALIDPAQLNDFNTSAVKGVEFAKKVALQIENDSRESGDAINYLEQVSNLPLKLEFPDFGTAIAHGSFDNPAAWNYVFDEVDAKGQFAFLPQPVCFIGHTHTPFVFSECKGLIEVLADRMPLEKGDKWLINPGSVGQPRDGDCRASYGILEIAGEDKFFTLRRVFYNIGSTASRIDAAGLPKFLGERLFCGE